MSVCTIGKIGIDGIDGLYVHSVIRGVMCGGELGSVLTNHRLPPKYTNSALLVPLLVPLHRTAGIRAVCRSTMTAVAFSGHLRQILRLIVLSLQV